MSFCQRFATLSRGDSNQNGLGWDFCALSNPMSRSVSRILRNECRTESAFGLCRLFTNIEMVHGVKRTLSVTAIISLIFFNVSGGPYALEDVQRANHVTDQLFGMPPGDFHGS